MSTTTGEPTAQDWAVINLLSEGHALTGHYEGRGSLAETKTICRCGWSSEMSRGVNSGPQRESADAHLASVLPEGTVTAPCWCGRLAVRVEGTGAWYHADKRFMGHGALSGGQPPHRS